MPAATTEAPASSETSEEAILLSAAEAVDRGEDVAPEHFAKLAPVESAPKEEGTRAAVPDATKAPAAKPDPKSQPTDKVSPSADDKDQTLDPEAKPGESKFSRQQRSDARLKPTWEKANEIKAENARKEADLERREREFADRQRATPPAPVTPAVTPKPASGQSDLTVEDYLDAAARFEKEGDFEKADRARKMADGLLRESAKTATATARSVQPQQAEAQEVLKAFEGRWNQARDKTLGERPELLNDAAVKESVVGILNQFPILHAVDDGFLYATQIHDLRAQAAMGEALRTENEQLKAENEKLRKTTEIGGSLPGSVPSKKTFESMSDEEQQHYLAEQANRIDSGG